MMASATNGRSRGSPGRMEYSSTVSSRGCWRTGGPRPFPASMQDRQQPMSIVWMPWRLLVISPLLRASNPGIKPGFLTIKAMSSAGSPPMLKNSSPLSSTNFWKVGCVASLTR